MTNYKLTKRKITDLGLFLLACLFSVSTAFGGSTTVPKAMLNDAPDALSCQAAFESEIYTGNLPSLGGITFHNLSEGDFDHLSWDFGDGTIFSSVTNETDHFFDNAGTYLVTLTVWTDDQTCFSVETKEVSVSLTNDPCDISPCVYPGDANNDGKADMYDLMHIGMGFGATGPLRAGDPGIWAPQAAEDWATETGDGVNHKHLDADGNGEISYEDMIPLIDHYSPMEETIIYTESDGPRVYLDFEADTIVINEDTEEIVSISAGLVLGNFNTPLEDLYALSFFLDYDTTLTETSNGVMLNYNQNSFLGDTDEVISYGNDIRENKQIDVAITRINSTNISGFGRVATFDFSIIIDIIDGRTEMVVPFDVPINGIKAIDKDGNVIKVSLDQQPAQVVFVKETTSSIHPGNPLNHKVSLFPNPVNNGSVNITFKDLNGEAVLFYNTLGQLLKSTNISGEKANVSVADLPAGIYQLQIQTNKGMVAKRLIVE